MLPRAEGFLVRLREGLVLIDLILQGGLLIVPLRILALDVAPAWLALTAFGASLLQVLLAWVRLGLRAVRVLCRYPFSLAELAPIQRTSRHGEQLDAELRR